MLSRGDLMVGSGRAEAFQGGDVADKLGSRASRMVSFDLPSRLRLQRFLIFLDAVLLAFDNAGRKPCFGRNSDEQIASNAEHNACFRITF